MIETNHQHYFCTPERVALMRVEKPFDVHDMCTNDGYVVSCGGVEVARLKNQYEYIRWLKERYQDEQRA